MPDDKRKRAEIASIIMPLYNDWHLACVKNPDARHTRNLESALWKIVRSYQNEFPICRMPTKQTAAIGRWIVKQLPGHAWYAFRGVVVV